MIGEVFGLLTLTRSLRPYDSLATIWDMVARTAYTQLNYSPLLLLGTLVGMPLIYLVPPVCIILGAVWGDRIYGFIGMAVNDFRLLPDNPLL